LYTVGIVRFLEVAFTRVGQTERAFTLQLLPDAKGEIELRLGLENDDSGEKIVPDAPIPDFQPFYALLKPIHGPGTVPENERFQMRYRSLSTSTPGGACPPLSFEEQGQTGMADEVKTPQRKRPRRAGDED
jgi:hypothetical protein